MINIISSCCIKNENRILMVQENKKSKDYSEEKEERITTAVSETEEMAVLETEEAPAPETAESKVPEMAESSAPVTAESKVPEIAETPKPAAENSGSTERNSARYAQNKPADNNSEFKPMQRTVRAKLATLRENQKSGWKRLVTVTQWGGGKFKLDIRDWSSDMTRSTKGMTFTRSEAEKLRNVLSIIDLSIIDDYTQEEPEQNSSGRGTILKAV